MLLSNPATFDQRPLKEAHSLAHAGMSVTILAWDREGETSHDTCFQDGVIIKRMRLRAGHGTPKLTVPKLFIFYLWCLVHLLVSRADVTHCHDVDTLPVGIASKILGSSRRLVYDMHDLPEAFLRFFPLAQITSSFFISVSRRMADLILVASEGYIPYLKARGLKDQQIVVVLNAPALEEGREGRSPSRTLNVLYYGALEEERGVRQLVEATRDLKSVNLAVAGRGSHSNWIASVSKLCPNIRFLGWLSFAKLEPLIMEADLMPSLYAPTSANILLSTPNKLLRSFSLSIPGLVTAGTFQARIVEKYRCGLAIKWGDVEEARKTISALAEDRSRFGEFASSAYRAFRTELNWETMETRLKGGYERILGVESNR